MWRQPEGRLEGNMPINAAVVAEDEPVEVGVDVLAAKTVIGPVANETWDNGISLRG